MMHTLYTLHIIFHRFIKVNHEYIFALDYHVFTEALKCISFFFLPEILDRIYISEKLAKCGMKHLNDHCFSLNNHMTVT